MSRITGQETILFWFIVAGLGIFTPLIILGVVILKKEGFKINNSTITSRLRFRKLTRSDLLWTLSGFIAIAVLSGFVMKIISFFIGQFDHSPSFMTFEPLTKGRYWLLLVWFPYWVLNILGEEFIWRGVMLPRQELVFGKATWIIHGFGWGLFHVAFGWKLMITLIPIIFIQSFVVQKTKNTWTGVLLHAGINGPSFIAISLGLL
ncbi:MAG: CPBP family intramembrane metalloprotease [Ignavibacteriaceae bacterium]|nr:CPBP family intramembrane metalloprotease [Ignavibacteriaceae bacterium]